MVVVIPLTTVPLLRLWVTDSVPVCAIAEIVSQLGRSSLIDGRVFDKPTYTLKIVGVETLLRAQGGLDADNPLGATTTGSEENISYSLKRSPNGERYSSESLSFDLVGLTG